MLIDLEMHESSLGPGELSLTNVQVAYHKDIVQT